jgi:hypothetical protein
MLLTKKSFDSLTSKVTRSDLADCRVFYLLDDKFKYLDTSDYFDPEWCKWDTEELINLEAVMVQDSHSQEGTVDVKVIKCQKEITVDLSDLRKLK